MLFGRGFLGGAQFGQQPRKLGVWTGQYTIPVETPETWARRTRPINLPEETETIQISSAARPGQQPRRRR